MLQKPVDICWYPQIWAKLEIVTACEAWASWRIRQMYRAIEAISSQNVLLFLQVPGTFSLLKCGDQLGIGKVIFVCIKTLCELLVESSVQCGPKWTIGRLLFRTGVMVVPVFFLPAEDQWIRRSWLVRWGACKMVLRVRCLTFPWFPMLEVLRMGVWDLMGLLCTAHHLQQQCRNVNVFMRATSSRVYYVGSKLESEAEEDWLIGKHPKV